MLLLLLVTKAWVAKQKIDGERITTVSPYNSEHLASLVNGLCVCQRNQQMALYVFSLQWLSAIAQNLTDGNWCYWGGNWGVWERCTQQSTSGPPEKQRHPWRTFVVYIERPLVLRRIAWYFPLPWSLSLSHFRSRSPLRLLATSWMKRLFYHRPQNTLFYSGPLTQRHLWHCYKGIALWDVHIYSLKKDNVKIYWFEQKLT